MNIFPMTAVSPPICGGGVIFPSVGRHPEGASDFRLQLQFAIRVNAGIVLHDVGVRIALDLEQGLALQAARHRRPGGENEGEAGELEEFQYLRFPIWLRE